jgi:putative peptidoglycan lipid II flippase
MGAIAEPLARPPEKAGGVIGQVAGLMAFQILSPAAALLAEVALAWRFGASGVVDAYRVTVLLLIYGQQIFVTNILPCVLVPIFAEYRARENEAEAWVLADSVALMLLLFGALIAMFLFFRPDATVSMVAPGLAGDVRTAAVFLIRWCGLAFIPMCWTGAACGILYAYEIFQIAPLAQAASNMLLAVAILLAGGKLGVASLAIGLIAGSAVSTGIHLVKVATLRRRFGPKSRFTGFNFRAIGKAFRIAAPLLASVISAQSTSVMVNRVLSRLSVGTLAAFGYAFKMGTLVRLTPFVMTTVLFPKFSAAWYSKGQEDFTEGCWRAIRATIYLAVPVTALCWAFRTPLIALTFQRGEFSSSDVSAASALFGFLILNGPPACVAIALGRAFYALQEARTPLLTDVTGNLLELILIPLLAAHFGASGAATAYMITPWITTTGLIILFRLRFGTFPFGDLTRLFLWTAIAASSSAWAGSIIGRTCVGLIRSPILSSAVEVASGGAAALTLFYIVTLLLGFPEARSLRGFLIRGLNDLRLASLRRR